MDWKNWRQTLLPQLEGFPLLPIGAGAEGKAPIDISTGKPWSGWPTASLSPKQIGKTPPQVVTAVGTRCGPDAGGLVAFDFDGQTAIEAALAAGCDPHSAGWIITRPTAQDRMKAVFRVPEEKWPAKGSQFAGKVKRDTGKGEQIEVFFGTGQIVVAGLHKPTGAFLEWQGGPSTITDLPEEWLAFWLSLKQPQPAPRPRHPAPRPNRTHNQAIPLLDLLPRDLKAKAESGCGEGDRDDTCFKLAAAAIGVVEGCAVQGQLITGTADELILNFAARCSPPFPENEALKCLRSAELQPRGADQGLAKRIAFHRRGRWPKSSTDSSSSPPATKSQAAPFRVLGWNETRDKFWVQTGWLGQVAAIPHTKAGLQRIAPLEYWETMHPSSRRVDWDAAISAVYEQAESAGIFQLENLRGRGVWLDRGRIVWNLGDRLEVEGALIRHADFQDRVFTYASLPPLAIDPKVAPLTDGEGQAILDLFTKAMCWHGPDDGLLVLGHAVLANVGGALDIRPGLQITGGSGEGKSTVISGMMRPLHAGLGIFDGASTEAGIRQAASCDALPIMLDESEQETPDQREGHLRLLRLSYDGKPLRKGTQGGKANVYSMRSAIVLAGINATVPNQADRNRLVFARPRKLPPEMWAQFKEQRNNLLTITTGQRLLRRTISNLHILLANIRTMASVIGQTLDTSRSAETYAPLLAAAHSITSTQQLDQAEALAWLRSVGWDGPDEETREALAADSEARACLDHLLSHPVPWRDSTTGNTNVRSLIQILCGNSGDQDGAVEALGHLDIKVDPVLGLVVGNACKCFTGSRWANKAHHERLLELPGAERTSTAVWFKGGGSHRAVAVPINLAQTTIFSDGNVTRLTPNGAPDSRRQAKAS